MSNHDNVRAHLLRKYPGSAHGTWRIFGEDPNCDFGGYHHSPELETVTGTYANVVEYALTLPSFFSWGGGGHIEKLDDHHKNVDRLMTDPNIKRLEEERKKTAARLEQIDKELEQLKRE